MTAPPYKDLSISWNSISLPWKSQTQPWNDPSLPWQQNPSGPSIAITNSSITETASTGVSVGTLSVLNGTGTYTFTISADPSNKFDVNGSNGVNLFNDAAIDYETTPSLSVTIHADNGAGSTADRQLTIAVVDVAAALLTSPTDIVATASASQGALSVTSNNGTGMLYVVVTTSATPPTATQVKNGQNNGGTAAVFAASASAASGANTFTATGLSASTQYYSYFAQQILPAELSSVAAADGFTTGAGSSDSARALAFDTIAVAAYPSLDTTHRDAYKALLNSLTTAGLFNSDGTSNYLEGLYCFRSQDSSGALQLLDLTAAQQDLAAVSAGLTWTVDSGVARGTSSGLKANGRTTANFQLFSQNSAHIGAYSTTNTTTTTGTFDALYGFYDTTPTPDVFSQTVGKDSAATPANSVKYLMNGDATGADFQSSAVSSGAGHFVTNRSDSTHVQCYQDGSNIGNSADPSSSGYSSINRRIWFLSSDSNSGGLNPCANGFAFGHFGASLNSTQVNALTSAFAAYIATIHP